jgi:hypothetical protein
LGNDAEKFALIVRALYGMKSAGKAFRNYLAECMKHLGWHPSRADRDLWMKAETRPDDGVLYWAYILIYVDGILCVHNDPGYPLAKLDGYFKVKEGSIQVPTFYLGEKLKKTVLPNGVVARGMSSSKYVQSAVQNVKEYLEALPGDHMLMKKASGPFSGGYKPELDEIPELDPTRANFYESQIVILRWCVELVRIDIITEVSMLSNYLCLPLVCHLEAVFHVFAYLGLHHNAIFVFDPTYPDVDMGIFIKTECKSMYGDVKEMISSDSHFPRVKEVDLRLFVDSDHAGERITRLSRTGFVIYLNMAPIVWFSKLQPTVDSSVFGAECVVMYNGIETCRGLCYKLRMMGMALSGPTFAYGDNMSVVHNTQRPESVWRNKSNSICYHAVREP